MKKQTFLNKRYVNTPGICFLALLTTLIVTRAVAQNTPLVIEKPWIPAMPEVAITGAAYMTIKNTGTKADQLREATSDAAERVELHTHSMEQGMMQMRPVEAIDLPAGGTVTLEPTGLHVMLINLKRPLKDGETVTLNLRFAEAGNLRIDVPVRSSAP